MGYTKKEMLIILSSSLERLQKDINSFRLHYNGDSICTIQSDNGELRIKLNSELNSLTIDLGSYYGKHYFGVFDIFSWKSKSIFYKMLKILQNKEEAIEETHRLQNIHQHFPEIVNKEFEKTILTSDQHEKE